MVVGDEFYEAHADSYEGTVRLSHWIITAIRKGRVFAIEKTDYTWVKRSKTSGDYGWADSISAWNRKTFQLAAGPPTDWARTPAAAYGKALPSVEAAIKRLTKVRAQLTGQRTKARTRASSRKGRALSPNGEAVSAGKGDGEGAREPSEEVKP